jgi:UTP:GlnB (protein PII) uridylyltransferase
LHALTIENASGIDDAAWERLGEDLRMIGKAGDHTPHDFTPIGHASVTVDGSRPERTLVRVLATDQIGLLSAICRWFADHELSVESLHAASDGRTARDVFIVNGSFTPRDLSRHLSRN